MRCRWRRVRDPLPPTRALNSQKRCSVFLAFVLPAKCIDEYRRLRLAASQAKQGEVVEPIDPSLVAVVERMFERCFHDGEYTQVMCTVCRWRLGQKHWRRGAASIICRALTD